MSTAARAKAFSSVETLIVLLRIPWTYVFHRHSVYLVDRVDLIHNLYRLWKGSQPTSLVTPHLELSTPMHVGHLWEFVPEAALEDLGLSQ